MSRAEEAYAIAVERDTIQDYQAFLRRYPDHRLARRVTALLVARREAIVWRRTLARNTREAYWTYLRRYPNGPHAPDSRRRLARLSAPYAPPAALRGGGLRGPAAALPEVERVEMVEVVTIIRDVPPPRTPAYLLPRWDEDEEFVTIIREPPPPPIMAGVLPIPMAFPVPVRARPPRSFYQPIAPVTPRGPMAIPVAAPPVFGALMGDERGPRPRRGLRPEQVVPRQPGLAAPIEPIPVSADPRAPREDRGARPGEPPRVRPGAHSRASDSARDTSAQERPRPGRPDDRGTCRQARCAARPAPRSARAGCCPSQGPEARCRRDPAADAETGEAADRDRPGAPRQGQGRARFRPPRCIPTRKARPDAPGFVCRRSVVAHGRWMLRVLASRDRLRWIGRCVRSVHLRSTNRASTVRRAGSREGMTGPNGACANSRKSALHRALHPPWSVHARPSDRIADARGASFPRAAASAAATWTGRPRSVPLPPEDARAGQHPSAAGRDGACVRARGR